MVRGLFQLFVFFILSALHGQEKNYITSGYYSNVYLADSLFLVKKYDSSYEILNKLFLDNDPLDFDPYYEYRTLVKSAWLIGQRKQAHDGIQDLISNYGLDWSMINHDSVLYSIVEEMDVDRELYNELRKNYESQTYPEIKEKIKQMVLLDQKYRGGKGIYLANKEQQDSIDALNRKEILAIIDSIGYPTLKKLGMTPDAHFNESKVLNILLHFDFKTRQEILLPKIRKLVEIGDCNPEVYGYIYDQMQFYSKKPQKYGSYEGSKNTDSLHFHRKSIGLPHVDYMQWRFKHL